MSNKNRKYGLLSTALIVAVSVLAFLVCWLLVEYAGAPAVPTVLFGGAACVAVQIAIFLSFRFFSMSAQVISYEMSPAMGNMTLDLMIRLDLPVLILDDNARAVWYNRAFSTRAGAKTVLYGKKFESFSPVPLSEVVEKSSGTREDGAPSDGCMIETFDACFSVKAYPTRSEEREFTITVWQDES